MESEIFIGIIIVCIVLIVVGIAKHNFNLLVNFLVRTIGGLAIILILNIILVKLDVQIQVGVNPYTILFSGLLGIPGVIGLYAVSTYFYLTP